MANLGAGIGYAIAGAFKGIRRRLEDEALMQRQALLEQSLEQGDIKTELMRKQLESLQMKLDQVRKQQIRQATYEAFKAYENLLEEGIKSTEPLNKLIKEYPELQGLFPKPVVEIREVNSQSEDDREVIESLGDTIENADRYWIAVTEDGDKIPINKLVAMGITGYLNTKKEEEIKNLLAKLKMEDLISRITERRATAEERKARVSKLLADIEIQKRRTAIQEQKLPAEIERLKALAEYFRAMAKRMREGKQTGASTQKLREDIKQWIQLRNNLVRTKLQEDMSEDTEQIIKEVDRVILDLIRQNPQLRNDPEVMEFMRKATSIGAIEEEEKTETEMKRQEIKDILSDPALEQVLRKAEDFIKR